MVSAAVVRVEKGGIVITTPQRRFTGGEDLRVWLAIDAQTWTFEASVIRAGVPVPDRSQDGILLGFIDRFQPGGPAASGGGRVLSLVAPRGGTEVSLLEPPAQLVQLNVSGATFTLPASFKLVFVESGSLSVRVGAPSVAPSLAKARVRALAPSEGLLLYDLRFEQADDPERFRVAIESLANQGKTVG